jgi:hypothetical protein
MSDDDYGSEGSYYDFDEGLQHEEWLEHVKRVRHAESLVAAVDEAVRARDACALARACSALMGAARVDAGAVEEAGALAALAAASAVLKAVRADHAGALGNLASGNDDEAVEARWQADTPAYDTPAYALGHACVALSYLICRHDASYLTGSNAGTGATRRWTAVVQAGVFAALVAAAHEPVPVSHEGALEYACKALASLAAGDDQAGEARRTALVQAGAPAALVAAAHEAIRAPPRAGCALEWACGALANLAAGDDQAVEARRTALVQAGALVALAAAVHEAVRAGHAIALGNLAFAAELAAARAAAVHEAVRAGHAGALGNLASGNDDEAVEARWQADAPACALGHACSALVDLAFCNAEAVEARWTALVQAGALAALVAAAHEAALAHDEAVRAGPAGALASRTREIVVWALTNFALAHGDDETKAAAMVQAGAHEVIMTETQDPLRRDSLVALAGPAGVEPDEPSERIMNRILRVKRESYWVERHGRTLSVAATAFRDNKIPLEILAKACVLANGDELVPKRWKQGSWRAVGGRLLESAERALLEALNTTPVLADPDGGAAPQNRRPNVSID